MLGIPAIAEALKVRHVLEGSVRRAGATIRITAQLIDAETDKHLWSQNYDRQLSAKNVFAIQDEIANAIVGELVTSMSLAAEITKTVIVSGDTDNLDAYQLFLRGRQQYRARSFQNIPETIEIFEQAVALDSEFARAWAGLAAITGVASSWGHVDEDYKQQSRDAAQRAIELDDELALPYAVLGSLLTEEVPANSVKVFELFAKALERNPDEVNALLWRGVHRIAVGEFEGASNDLTHCLAVDAAYENCRQHLAAAEYYAGNQDAAFLLFEQSVANGGTARGLSFAAAYVTAGDLRSALHTAKWVINSFNFTVKLDQFYRAMTRPDFDFVKERREFEIEVEAETGASLDWHTLNDIEKISFRNCEAMTPNATMSIWWDPSFPHFLTSPHRKRLIRELGIYDYWLARGFPSQCRSAGDDDFECDQ